MAKPRQHSTQSASAVARLLERAPGPDDVRLATDHVARRTSDLEALTGSVFIFRLGSEWLALISSVIDEVVEPRVIHSLPHRRDGIVRGLVNVRGQLTLCVALEPLLQLEEGSHAGAGRGVLGRRLVVLVAKDQRVAFEADEVHGSHRYDPASVGNVPATVAQSMSRFSTGVLARGDHSVGLLDAELVLHAINRRLG